jgi:AraC-like DNA-binding protein
VPHCFKSPRQPLNVFVERLWHCSDAPAHSRERIVPSGTIELVINLQEDEIRIYDPERPDQCRRFSGAVVSGAYGKPFVVDTREHASIIGVHFRAGGAYPIFQMPIIHLQDTHVDLETLWGRAALDLREQLCAAATPTERFGILARAITNRLPASPISHGAVRYALDIFTSRNSDCAVGAVVKQSGYSQRRFNQLFKREVGLPPKLFTRIRRFQESRVAIDKQRKSEWAQFALAGGYFDQSHFINEFREFSGLSPGEYAQRRSELVLPNHVPLTD